MSNSIPHIRGPNLPPFSGDIEDIEFLRLVSSENSSTSDEVPHSRVFKINAKGKILALKVVGNRITLKCSKLT
jgi:hypothetical protein